MQRKNDENVRKNLHRTSSTTSSNNVELCSTNKFTINMMNTNENCENIETIIDDANDSNKNNQQSRIKNEDNSKKNVSIETKNLKYFAKPSLSHASLDSVVETYREQFAPTEYQSAQQKEDIKNHPQNIPWKQQTLPCWQPQYKPATIVSIYLGFGFVMIAMGVPMLLTMNSAHETSIEYTKCNSTDIPTKTCADIINEELNYPSKECKCTLNIKIPIDYKLPVYIYYELDGFFQNHRRYVASVDMNQLYGKDVSPSTLESNCAPYGLRKNDSMPYGPCGAIANSLFSDRFELFSKTTKVKIDTTDIVWPTDKLYRFKNPSNFSKYVKPINWLVPADQLDPTDPSNNGYQNEHFIVWMRTAAFPKFRKLWGRILPQKDYKVLSAGEYSLNIIYSFKTIQNKLYIPKRFIIATSTWLGGRNLFLPILYLICGSLSIITGISFLILTKYYQTKDRHRTDTVSLTTGSYQAMGKTKVIA